MAERIKQKWSAGTLVFYEEEGANRTTTGYPLLSISPTEVTVGGSSNDIDFRVFLGAGTSYALFDAGSGQLTMEAAPIGFSGTFTSDCIDFANVVIDHTGSNGPCFIRAGTYDSPVSNADLDQSGMIRLYGETSADGSSYDRGIFICLKTTGLKGIFPIAGLAEIKAQTGVGPNKAQAGQFTAMLQDATSKLATMGGDGTAGMYAIWAKVGGHGSAEASSGSRVAALWLDNQLQGSVLGEEYAAFITTGGSVPTAVFGFETTGAGWAQFLYFDSTCSSTTPVVTSGLNVSGAGASEAYLKVLLDATQYGIPLIAV